MNKPLLNIDLFEWRVYTIKHVKDNQNIAFRIKKQVIILLLLVIINLVIIGLTSRSITLIEKNELDANATSGTVKEYSFLTLGIIIDPLEWSSKGTFELSINETFDFSNSGPAMLILDFSSEGDKPDSPGYELEGKFNLEIFDSVISRSILPSSGNGDVVRQIVIPFDAEGRVFSNQFTMTISCINDYSSNYEGLLLIHSSSKFVIGDVLLINDYGNYSAPVFPEKLEGTTSLGGIKLYSYFQFTIDNETIVSKADSKMSFVIEYTGDVSLSLVLFDKWENGYLFEKNETVENLVSASIDLTPNLGFNYYLIEISIYGNSLWGTDFNLDISDYNIEIIKSPGGNFGFGDLEIPFFQWPSVPIVGVLVLIIWIMPYSILKYRKWKKLPGEVDIAIIEDDDSINILDPEGLTAGDDDDDDFDDTFDFNGDV